MVFAALAELGYRQHAVPIPEVLGCYIELLSQLTNDDLKDIGVVSLGHRKKLLEAIAQRAGAISVSAEPALSEPQARGSAERRQVTVMFSDLVGSTALSGQMDPKTCAS